MSEEIKPVVSTNDEGDIKLDFRPDAVQEQSTDEVPVRDESDASEGIPEQNVEETNAEPAGEERIENDVPEQKEEVEQPVLQEITEEQVEEATEELHEEVEEAIAEAKESGVELPENIQKVVDFMNETGGTLEDYVRLNTDYASLNEDALLREYYQNANPHLDSDDIDFLMQDKFSYDEDLDDEVEVRRKKVERKQELAKAKNHLEGLKSKYYDEIKMGSRLSPDQQKAVDFFNRYNKESEESAKIAERQSKRFRQESAKVFNDKFEGFDFNVGDKKYRFNVKDANKISETQSDINNFIGKFLDKNGEMSDAKGYHKSLFTAMNPDQIAQHFYEQGKADALKDSVAKSKNVNMNPRGVHEKVTASNGVTYKVLNPSESGSKLKVRFKK
jgi:hypothetical protein